MHTDPAELEIFKNLFHSVAEEMGAALRRSAFSPNIKERRDYSCAVFDGKGRVVAMGDHMPVHLGSMPMSVAAAIESLDLGPGDIAMLNDPYAGGTHLPDITLVMPVGPSSPRAPRGAASKSGRHTPAFYVANRAHHSDIGGAQPASMGLSEEIYQEGLRIPPVTLARGGRIERDVLAVLLANVRTPCEREGDLMAQIASCRLGERRLMELRAKYGAPKTDLYLDALYSYSERLMREALRRIPEGVYRAEDCLDDDGFSSSPVRLRVSIRIHEGEAIVNFDGTSPACRGSVNAVEAITVSAVFYVFRCLLGEEVPASAGLMAPITVRAPKGSVVNAGPPAAVAAGNVETSQRIVDVLLRALARALPDRIPAASSGTMNNLSFGGLLAPRGRQGLQGLSRGEPFTYYETIAGGMGARPAADGLSGVHTHMTNSLNTPVEAFESAYPVRVLRYSLRRGSGGAGRFRGGDGVVRELEFLTDVRGSILSDRRRFRPYGLAGGGPGAAGKNLLRLASGKPGGRSPIMSLPSKTVFNAPAGSVLRVETPGGGGWGREERQKAKGKRQKAKVEEGRDTKSSTNDER
ncbi:MAG TPA: hydantoinase B/oxoprolinase family protein [Terriglobia bacterium]|nr:hydantoinase B/oxoprolinase family protein [Terriglobia bacterium]